MSSGEKFLLDLNSDNQFYPKFSSKTGRFPVLAQNTGLPHLVACISLILILTLERKVKTCRPITYGGGAWQGAGS